jgi:hypothetical protein
MLKRAGTYLRKLFGHESVPWSLAGVAQTLSANSFSLWVSWARLSAALFLRYQQLRFGGAFYSPVSPHLIETLYCVYQSVAGFLECGGVIPTQSSLAESHFRAWAYLWCSGFLGSLLIHDTKFGKRLEAQKSKWLNALSNANLWQAPQSWFVFDFALSPLRIPLGKLPGTQISNFRLALGAICVVIALQAIYQGIKPSRNFLMRHFGLIAASILNALAAVVILKCNNTSWGFYISQYLSIVGASIYLWRNRATDGKV